MQCLYHSICARCNSFVFFPPADMEDLSVLKVLDEPDEQLSSLWALMPQRSPKPDLPQLFGEDHETKGKGSRFAKFIAERREVFQKPTVHNKGEGLPSKTLRSKL